MTEQTASQLQRAAERAKRLRVLLDLELARTGKKVAFADLSGWLAVRGVSLSRARWSYIVHAHRDCEDIVLLDAICDFFGAPKGYLNGEADIDLDEKELDVVRAMRAADVTSYATRTLGDLSPGALATIQKVLAKEAARVGVTQ
jgi:hypothetical protein